MEPSNKRVAVIVRLLCGVWLAMGFEPSFADSGVTVRVAVVVAYENYSIVQYQELEKTLAANAIPFDTVAIRPGRAQSGAHHVGIDYTLSDLDTDRYRAFVFVGGFGALNDLLDSPLAISLIQRAAGQGKIVGGS